MRFVLGIIGLVISSTAFAADHKVSLFLSETGGFHPLNIGKDATPTVQADQHPDVPAGIFFQIAANGASQYEVVGHFCGCRSSVGRLVLSVCERSVNGGYSGHLCHL